MAERKQNGKKETKHVNNAESKNQKEQIKKQETKKKKGRRHFLTGVWVWKLKNMEDQTKILRQMVDGVRMASSVHLKVQQECTQ